MADTESTIPPPQTPAEIAIHIGYLRRDIAGIAERQEKDMKELRIALQDLGTHFVSEAEFRPYADQTQANKKDLETLKSWRDNLSGRMVGFAAGISGASALGASVLTSLFGG